MKAVTEFAVFTLSKGLQTKAALVAEGKTPEDIQSSLGTTFKYEGEKLTYFMNALEVAGSNLENLKRVVVISLNEGENAPAKAVQVEAHHYVPEMMIKAGAAPAAAPGKGGKGGRRGGGRGDSPKGSPWGLSQEEIAAKGGKAAAKLASGK